jgi:hypothetical protein
VSEYLVVEFTDAPMRWDDYPEAYVRSGDRLGNFHVGVDAMRGRDDGTYQKVAAQDFGETE